MGDSKAYRIADFYLPKYKIYLEYFGQWNKHEDANIRYKEKKKVYSMNDIPCIYLYPENLGIIEYTLDFRIKTELKKRKMTKELFKHRLDRLLNQKGDLFFWLSLSILLLSIADYKTNPEGNLAYIIACSSIICFQLYRLLTGYNKYFRDN